MENTTIGLPLTLKIAEVEGSSPSMEQVPLAWIISCNVFGVLAALWLIGSKIIGLFTKRGGQNPNLKINNESGNDDDQNAEEKERRETENEIRNLGFIQFLGFGVAAYNQWKAFDSPWRPWSIRTATSPIYDLGVAVICALLYFFTSTRKCISIQAFKKLRTWLIIGGLLLILGTLITLRLAGIISDELHVILLCTKSATVVVHRSFRIWSLYTTQVEWKPQCFAMDFLEMAAGLFAIVPLILMSVYLGDARVWRLNYPRAILAILLVIVNFLFCFVYHIPANNRAAILKQSERRLPEQCRNDQKDYGAAVNLQI